MTTGSRKKAPATSQLRIIGGQWRGRKLPILEAEGLRPTGDRMRETLFNWLAPDLYQSRCLDLFAGSGALGFEALSRGASAATLVERYAPAVAQLRANRTRLSADTAEVIEADALSWLRGYSSKQNESFQIVFVDPPFDADLWQPTFEILSASGVLGPDSLIYVESPKQKDYRAPASWLKLKEKVAGAICARLFVASGTSIG